MVDLMDGPQSCSELRRSAGGVSDKMLAQTLRDLETGGLITRTVLTSRPPTVQYDLTDLARGATTATPSAGRRLRPRPGRGETGTHGITPRAPPPDG
ncbi:helix-turn-helix domain-containing protein [Streptomyces sp. MB09-02B]|uniref:winged helix-turn-helix transcriptional regulator n=1 Tax=Streptomyces sp. MB09-02B TaxID=3028667 RepID=UPI0029A71747|nr:helix-turn-helix domain-containing protein [Streptomyces sp. MB09-02B]MDX3646203.1 helix-turn-helix domain-containing protein [Streptomyces sp. MB09-02B]